MKGKRIAALLMTLVLTLSLGALAGCGGGEGEEGSGGISLPGFSGPTIDTAEFEWREYTMGIDLISDDPKTATPAGASIAGKPIKICFKYLSSTTNSDGFVSANIFKDMEESPITLVDTEGNVYTFTGSIGDFVMKGDFATDGFAMADLQPRLSIFFDVPADLSLEDLTLDTGDGQELKLINFISAEYEADRND